MRFLAVKLGELNPHSDVDSWFIWVEAVAEFLWPTSNHDGACEGIISHPMFLSWCEDLGDMLGVLDGCTTSRLYPAERSWDVRLARESDRHSESGKGGGVDIAAELFRLWEKSWAALTKPDSSGRGFVPQGRHAGRGLKFCLLINVLRYGLRTGSPPVDGLHNLAKWENAVDAASLHLALSILWTKGHGECAEFNPPILPWDGVKESAAGKLAKMGGVLTDIDELRGHAPGEGIEGFRKRLRATMDEESFRRVSRLAADFKKQGATGGSSSLSKWRKESLLSNWFFADGD